MFSFIRKVFIGLLASVVNASRHTQCVSSRNEKHDVQATFINLHLMNTHKDYIIIHLRLI